LLLRQSSFSKIGYSLANLFRGIVGIKSKTSMQQQLKIDITEREKLIKQAIYVIAQNTLRELQLATPYDTGATAQGWGLNVSQMGDTIHLRYEHSDGDAINRLNYGTRAHVIYPKHGQALKFKIGGQVVFAKYVHHPGTAALGFLEKAEARLVQDLDKLSTLANLRGA